MDFEQVAPILRVRLGPEATAGLIRLLDGASDEWKDGVIEIVGDRFERRLTEETSKVRIDLASGLSAVRQEMAQDFGRFRQEMAQEFGQVRQDMAQGFAEIRQEIARGNADLRQTMADQRFDILKWTFVFWTGQFFVTASFLVMLLRALRPA